MEAPEAPHTPHPHGLGRSWVDIVFNVAVVAISVVSLISAMNNSKAMEDLVATNARQASASVWPFIELTNTVNRGGAGDSMSVDVYNNGVGPARVHSFRVFVDGGPVNNMTELMNACCAEASGAFSIQTSSRVDRRVLPAGSSITPFRIQPTQEGRTGSYIALRDAWLGDRVNHEICFCSVFDECWLSSDRDATNGTSVASCPAVQSFMPTLEEGP